MKGALWTMQQPIRRIVEAVALPDTPEATLLVLECGHEHTVHVRQLAWWTEIETVRCVHCEPRLLPVQRGDLA